VTTDHVASYTCYRRGCRLEQCRTADRTQRKRYELQRLAGIPAVIPGPTIAAHLRTCIASGHTVRGIAARTGVSERAIGYILHGQATVTRKRAQSLLALKPLGLQKVDANDSVTLVGFADPSALRASDFILA